MRVAAAVDFLDLRVCWSGLRRRFTGASGVLGLFLEPAGRPTLLGCLDEISRWSGFILDAQEVNIELLTAAVDATITGDGVVGSRRAPGTLNDSGSGGRLLGLASVLEKLGPVGKRAPGASGTPPLWESSEASWGNIGDPAQCGEPGTLGTPPSLRVSGGHHGAHRCHRLVLAHPWRQLTAS